MSTMFIKYGICFLFSAEASLRPTILNFIHKRGCSVSATAPFWVLISTAAAAEDQQKDQDDG